MSENHNRFVAFLDILGFSRMVEDLTLEQVVQTFYTMFSSILRAQYRSIERQILKLASFRGAQELAAPLFGKLDQAASSINSKGLLESKSDLDRFLRDAFPFHCMIVSDSIIIYSDITPGGPARQEVFGLFVEFVRLLLVNAFKRQLMLRGAVSFGEFYADKANSIYLGKGFLKAVGLEKRQNWMGCALSEELGELLADYISTKHPQVPRHIVPGLRDFGPFIGHVINRYRVPAHDGSTFESYIINWYPALIGQVQLNDAFFQAVLTGIPSIDVKYHNTLAYMKWWQAVAESVFTRSPPDNSSGV